MMTCGCGRLARRRLCSTAVDSAAKSGAPSTTAAVGLADLELADGGGPGQHRADHEGVHARGGVTEQVVGAAVDADP